MEHNENIEDSFSEIEDIPNTSFLEFMEQEVDVDTDNDNGQLPLDGLLFSNELAYKDIKPDALVKQDNAIINGRWKMNIQQSRLFLVAVSMIDKNDSEFESYRIRAKELRQILDIKSGSIYTYLKRDIPKLMSTKIQLHRGNNDVEWINLVSSARYKDGDIYFRFNNDMKPYLLNLRKYTQTRLIDAMQFKSMYALRLFLLLKQYASTGWRQISVEELRHSLAVNKDDSEEDSDDLYPLIADFKKRVLEPALLEINKYGLSVQMEAKKEGKKIIAFKFNFINVTAKLPDIIELNPTNEANERLMYRMLGMGFNKRQCRYLGLCLVKGVFTRKELNNTLWQIDEAFRSNKKIPKDKQAGYAYSTFKKKFDLPNF